MKKLAHGKDQPVNELEALRKSQQLNQLILGNAHDFISIQKLDDLSYEYVNPTTLKVLGYSEEELVGKSATEFIHPDELEKVLTTLKEKTGKGEGSAEFRYRKKDGSYIWLEATATRPPDETENPSLIVISRDITERKQAEEALQKAHDELEMKVLEETLQLNQIKEQLQAKNKELTLQNEEKDKRAAELIIADKELVFQTGEKADRAAELIIANKELVFQNEEKDKRAAELIAANKELAFQNEEKEKRAAELLIAITRQMRTEQALRESENYYRTVFENTGAPTMIVEADMIISKVNQEWERVLGYKKEEIEGTRWTEYISDDMLDTMKEYHRLRRIDPASAPSMYMTRLKARDGKLREGLLNTGVIPGSAKSVATFIDLTDINRINRALKATSAGNTAMLKARNEQDLLQNVCQKIVEVGGYRMVWVGHVEKDERQTVRPVAYAGYEEGYLKTIDISLADPQRGSGPVGMSIRTGQPFICPDVTTDPRYIPWREEALSRGYQSVIVIPLHTDGGWPFGAISIYTAELDMFDAEEVKLLTEMADDLAYGTMSLRTRIERDESAQELEKSLEKMQRILMQAVASLGNALSRRDPYTAGHQIKVTQLATAIAEEMGFSKDQIAGISVAGNLHDIGKMGVPSEILIKPGKLSDLEFAIIKTHSQIGYEIIKDIEFPWPVAEILLQHHERMDGSGYSQGLAGDEILMEARVMAVADVVEAMASHRPYRPALGIDAALEEIAQNRGILYDPDVVDVCLKLFREKYFKLE